MRFARMRGNTMGQQFEKLTDGHIRFIDEQKVFFVATADRYGSVNLSPKGYDSFRVINPSRVVWQNLTGSGNETAAHVFNTGRMTIMFCSFGAKPLILRIYGSAFALHGGEPEWDEYTGLFEPDPGARQLFVVEIQRVATSCGYGVPIFEFVGERPTLREWANRKGEDGIREYWKKKNAVSIDGVGTRIERLKGL